MTPIHKAVTYLKSFKTAASLRDECRRRKVKGNRTLPYSCVLVALLRKKFSASFCVIPGPCKRIESGDGEIVADLPDSANDFALNFDAGKYPELETDR